MMEMTQCLALRLNAEPWTRPMCLTESCQGADGYRNGGKNWGAPKVPVVDEILVWEYVVWVSNECCLFSS